MRGCEEMLYGIGSARAENGPMWVDLVRKIGKFLEKETTYYFIRYRLNIRVKNKT